MWDLNVNDYAVLEKILPVTNGGKNLSALMFAVLYSRTETVKWLLANGADVNARREDGATALHMAASRKNVEIGRILLAHGADPTLKEERGKVPQSFLDQLRE